MITLTLVATFQDEQSLSGADSIFHKSDPMHEGGLHRNDSLQMIQAQKQGQKREHTGKQLGLLNVFLPDDIHDGPYPLPNSKWLFHVASLVQNPTLSPQKTVPE